MIHQNPLGNPSGMPPPNLVNSALSQSTPVRGGGAATPQNTNLIAQVQALAQKAAQPNPQPPISSPYLFHPVTPAPQQIQSSLAKPQQSLGEMKQVLSKPSMQSHPGRR
jgi:hypothetical protein